MALITPRRGLVVDERQRARPTAAELARTRALEARIGNLETEARLRARDAFLDDAVESGKIFAEQRPAVARAFAADPAATAAVIADLPTQRRRVLGEPMDTDANRRYEAAAAARLGIDPGTVV